MSTDFYEAKYPDISPYAYAANSPIFYVDPTGDTVRIYVSAKPVGTTEINLYSSGEMKANSKLRSQTTKVPVYEVSVSNESGSTATFYYTRVAYRGDVNNPDGAPEEVTFDPLEDGAKYSGFIKGRWGKKDNVLEIRPYDNNNSQTIVGKKARIKKDRVAVQFHVKGASDGCLLCVGAGQFESVEDGIVINGNDLEQNSSGTQDNFMNKIKEFAKEDKAGGKSDFILIQFDQIYEPPKPAQPEKYLLDKPEYHESPGSLLIAK